MRHAEKVLSVARDPSAPGRSPVFASWMRSLERYKLDPQSERLPERLGEAELRAARERMGALLDSAQPGLDRLFQAVGHAGCCVLLTDREGVPLERRGRAGDDAEFRGRGLWVGSVWSEAAEGTNGIGTALAEERALTIHRDQHFHSRNVGLSCTVAPLHDHEGRLAGALDVSSCRAELTEGFTGLIAAAVADAARRIEARHFRQRFAQARIVVAPQADWGAGALLAVDADDLVVGATRAARLACGIDDARLLAGLPAAEVLAVGAEDLRSAERGVVQRALARHGGNVAAAARSLGISRATLHRKLHRLALR